MFPSEESLNDGEITLLLNCFQEYTPPTKNSNGGEVEYSSEREDEIMTSVFLIIYDIEEKKFHPLKRLNI